MRWICVALLTVALAPAQAEVRTPSADYDAEIAAFERDDAAHPPQPGGVLFTGSSSIRMWTTLARDFPGVDVVNRGFGGSELRDVTHYAERIVAPRRPRLLVLYSGDNDLQNGRTPAEVEADLRALVAKLRAIDPAIRLAVVAIKPSPARAALLAAQRDANARLAKVEGVAYIDVHTPMLDAAGQPRAELFGPDQLHLDAEGYRLWRRIVAPHLAPRSDRGAGRRRAALDAAPTAKPGVRARGGARCGTAPAAPVASAASRKSRRRSPRSRAGAALRHRRRR